MKISDRSQELEWMDQGSLFCNTEEYENCLSQLDRVGRWLGGNRATFWAFHQLKKPPHSILDVGCGGGHFAIQLARHYPNAEVVGLDISPQAIDFAKRLLEDQDSSLSNVKFILAKTEELAYPPNNFDVVTSTLVCHHLSDEQLVAFLQRAYFIAKQSIILNDLHRHHLATLGFAALSPFFRNRVVVHDGLLSIRRAFTRQDWKDFLQAAEIPLKKASITWHWPFRWIVQIDTSSKEEVK
jgi:2-polyprenyl-3-methyl-5-hydroxy-6-metoxy-1,4-benzoquinol methylase